MFSFVGACLRAPAGTFARMVDRLDLRSAELSSRSRSPFVCLCDAACCGSSSILVGMSHHSPVWTVGQFRTPVRVAGVRCSLWCSVRPRFTPESPDIPILPWCPCLTLRLAPFKSRFTLCHCHPPTGKGCPPAICPGLGSAVSILAEVFLPRCAIDSHLARNKC